MHQWSALHAVIAVISLRLLKHFMWNMNQTDRKSNRSNKDIFSQLKWRCYHWWRWWWCDWCFFFWKNKMFDLVVDTHTSQFHLKFSHSHVFPFFPIDVIDVEDVCLHIHKKNCFQSTSDGVSVLHVTCRIKLSIFFSFSLNSLIPNATWCDEGGKNENRTIE